MIRAVNERLAEENRIRQEEAQRRFLEQQALLRRQAEEATQTQARQADVFHEHLQRREQRHAEAEEHEIVNKQKKEKERL